MTERIVLKRKGPETEVYEPYIKEQRAYQKLVDKIAFDEEHSSILRQNELQRMANYAILRYRELEGAELERSIEGLPDVS